MKTSDLQCYALDVELEHLSVIPNEDITLEWLETELPAEIMAKLFKTQVYQNTHRRTDLGLHGKPEIQEH